MVDGELEDGAMVEGVDPAEGTGARRFREASRGHGEPLLLRITEAAALCGLSPAKMAQLVSSGVVPSVTIGRSRRIVRAELEAWIADRISEAR